MSAALQYEPDLGPVSESDAEVYVASVCFKTGPPGPVGVEVERLVHDRSEARLPVPVERVREAVRPAAVLPGGGLLSFEPGGQLEVSSACAPDLPGLISSTRSDLAVVDKLAAEAGLRFSPVALDYERPPVRSLEHPRYAAMERHFDRFGPAGRTMMCSTASLQVSLEAGSDDGGALGATARWRRLHDLLPVLAAMFANSPFRAGAPSGWASTRQRVWSQTDPTRTAPVAVSDDPRSDWARYALDALVLCIPTEDGAWDAPRGLTLRQWLRGEGPRPATLADVDYHLSTLFPPVRPRGFVELRVIDAQDGDDWETAAAVVTSLMDDERAAARAADSCAKAASVPDAMTVAAREGLADRRLAAVAMECVEAAMDALPRLGADSRTLFLVESFAERYTSKGRSPADERLDLFRRTGSIIGPSESQEAGM